MPSSTQPRPLGEPQRWLQQRPPVTSLQSLGGSSSPKDLTKKKKTPPPLNESFWVSMSWSCLALLHTGKSRWISVEVRPQAMHATLNSGVTPLRPSTPLSPSSPCPAVLPAGWWPAAAVPPRPRFPGASCALGSHLKHQNPERLHSQDLLVPFSVQMQMLLGTGFPPGINNATETLPAGNQGTALQECFKCPSPHAHPSFPFQDQNSSF